MVTAGSPWSTGSLAARGDVRALPAAWPPCHTSCPLSSRAYGGGFCEYPDRIMDRQVGRGIRRTGKGTQEAPAASRRGPELPAQGQRGVGPSGAEGWPLVPEVTAGARCRGEHFLRDPG